MLKAANSGEEIHLFYRDRHHTDFLYHGQLRVVQRDQRTDQPSRFVFKIVESDRFLGSRTRGG